MKKKYNYFEIFSTKVKFHLFFFNQLKHLFLFKILKLIAGIMEDFLNNIFIKILVK